MSDYLQPAFYRFNQDSLELVRWIRTRVGAASSILDLGAGCGVIGIELARAFAPRDLVLVEAQEAFGEFLRKNLDLFLGPGTRGEVELRRFSAFTPSTRFELIACNPPYYLRGNGQESRDPRRGIARSFVLDGWPELAGCIDRSLGPTGRAYLVLKNERRITDTALAALGGFSVRTEVVGATLLIELSRLHEDRG